MQEPSPQAPAHDSFTRLLNRIEPDPEAFWDEARGLVTLTSGALVIDGSTLDKPYAKKIAAVTRHWSGRTKNDHFWEVTPIAKGRGLVPKYVLRDGWYAALENLKQVRDPGWLWLTRLERNRKSTAISGVPFRCRMPKFRAGGR